VNPPSAVTERTTADDYGVGLLHAVCVGSHSVDPRVWPPRGPVENRDASFAPWGRRRIFSPGCDRWPWHGEDRRIRYEREAVKDCVNRRTEDFIGKTLRWSLPGMEYDRHRRLVPGGLDSQISAEWRLPLRPHGTPSLSSTAPGPPACASPRVRPVSGRSSALETSAPPCVSTVTYRLSGNGLSFQAMPSGALTAYGWLAIGDTTTVQRHLQLGLGRRLPQRGEQVQPSHLDNGRQPTAHDEHPHSFKATTRSRSTYFDAAASHAPSVDFLLFGGSYCFNAPVIRAAAATQNGWLCRWNRATAPNSSYVFVADGSNSAGSVASPSVDDDGQHLSGPNPPTAGRSGSLGSIDLEDTSDRRGVKHGSTSWSPASLARRLVGPFRSQPGCGLRPRGQWRTPFSSIWALFRPQQLPSTAPAPN
jgi:hypothetical protein